MATLFFPPLASTRQRFLVVTGHAPDKARVFAPAPDVVVLGHQDRISLGSTPSASASFRIVLGCAPPCSFSSRIIVCLCTPAISASSRVERDLSSLNSLSFTAFTSILDSLPYR